MKLNSILILTFLLSFNLSAQEDSLRLKVINMLEVTGVIKTFDTSLDNIIAIQREQFKGTISDEFWDEYKKEISKDNFKEFNDAIIPIYLKYLTQEEIDQIVAFYLSPAGKSLLEKQPLIQKESMQLGAQLGEEASIRVMENMKLSNEEKFNAEINGCKKFRKGKFEGTTPDGSKVTITRTKDYQIESFSAGETKYKITWLSDCKYMLEAEDEDGNINDPRPVLTNIYEINGSTCKYIATDENRTVYDKSELSKLD